MKMEITAANSGRSMKNRENIGVLPLEGSVTWR
jgi:hypothetical protein